jgi:hypothetical protein
MESHEDIPGVDYVSPQHTYFLDEAGGIFFK